MAEVAPSAGGGGGNRNFLLILGGLGALLVIGLLALGAILFLPGLFGGNGQIAGITATPTRISIPATPTRTPQPSPTLVVAAVSTRAPDATLEPGAKLVRVTVGDGNAVTLTILQDAKEIVVEKGTWRFDEANRQLVLTFTELNGSPFNDEVVFRVEETADAVELIPVFYNKALHGDMETIEIERTDGSTETPLNLNPPTQGNPGNARPALQATATPEPVTGDYSGIDPPTEAGVRVMTLFLGPNNVAVMSTEEFGQTAIIQLGSWAGIGESVTVTLNIKDGLPSEEILSLTREGTNLVGTTTDPSLHGAQLSFALDTAAPSLDAPAPAGTYLMRLPLNLTPVLITATPVAITATPEIIVAGSDKGGSGAQPTAAAQQQEEQLPESGLGEELLLLFAGGMLLLGVIIVVRRMRAT